MSKEKKAEVMRAFVKSMEDLDIDKAVSLCTEDFEWLTPMQLFKGEAGLRKFFKWLNESVKDFKVAESGIGILVEGDKAFFEHTMSGEMQGEKVSFLAICTYEFSGDKIKTGRTVYDRLGIAEQASSQWLPKKLVKTIINQMQKGLD